VLRISFLRGLFEAKTIRLPDSFFMLGVWRACGRTELCFGAMSLMLAGIQMDSVIVETMWSNSSSLLQQALRPVRMLKDVSMN